MFITLETKSFLFLDVSKHKDESLVKTGSEINGQGQGQELLVKLYLPKVAKRNVA